MANANQPRRIRSDITLACPPEDGNVHLMVREMDWNRIKRLVREIAVEVNWPAAAGWAALGFGGNGIFAIIGLSYAGNLPSWVAPAVWIATGFSLVFALVMWGISAKIGRHVLKTQSHIEIDMNEIEQYLGRAQVGE